MNPYTKSSLIVSYIRITACYVGSMLFRYLRTTQIISNWVDFVIDYLLGDTFDPPLCVDMLSQAWKIAKNPQNISHPPMIRNNESQWIYVLQMCFGKVRQMINLSHTKKKSFHVCTLCTLHPHIQFPIPHICGKPPSVPSCKQRLENTPFSLMILPANKKKHVQDLSILVRLISP